MKPGAAVLDVGVSRVDGVLAGDVALDVREVAGLRRPEPGRRRSDDPRDADHERGRVRRASRRAAVTGRPAVTDPMLEGQDEQFAAPTVAARPARTGLLRQWPIVLVLLGRRRLARPSSPSGHFRRGSVLLAGTVVLAMFLRLLLRDDEAGMLVVRSKIDRRRDAGRARGSAGRARVRGSRAVSPVPTRPDPPGPGHEGLR